MNNAKGLAIVTGMLGIMLVVFAGQNPPAKKEVALKVPDASAVRIMKIQLDMTRLEQQSVYIQNQMKAINEAYEHDKKEMDQVKLDVLKGAGYSPNGWDIDLNALTFIPKASSKQGK